MREFRNLIEVGKDFLRIEFPTKSKKVRNEFLDESMKGKAVYEDVTLKYKDPEKAKLHIRDKLKGMGYTILHGELDHWDIKFGKGPIFKDVESKAFVLSFKAAKKHESSHALGYATMAAGIFFFAVSMLFSFAYASIIMAFAGYVSAALLILGGHWIGKPMLMWIKGTGVIAQRIEWNGMQSSQHFQFSGDCGFRELGKMNILRDDFDGVFKNLVEFLGEIKER